MQPLSSMRTEREIGQKVEVKLVEVGDTGIDSTVAYATCF